MKTHLNQMNVRSLRLRLGWSQAEMARRLSLQPIDIESMEKGQFHLTPALEGELEIISRQADELCEERRKSALSDRES